MEGGVFLCDPLNEPRHRRVCPQSFNRIIGSGQFRLREGLVDRAVTDLVQARGRPPGPALQLRDEVVDALSGVGRDRPPAQGADRAADRIGGPVARKQASPGRPETLNDDQPPADEERHAPDRRDRPQPARRA